MADPVENGKARVLIVEEEPIAHLAERALSKAGCECQTLTNTEAALSVLEQRGADVVLCATRFNGTDGVELLRKLQMTRPDVPVVMLTGEAGAAAAETAKRNGAFGWVTKPIDDEKLTAAVESALKMTSLERENRDLRRKLADLHWTSGFVAESPHSRQLVALVRRVAPSRSTALIEGESGTGKELIARMLHYWSNRADGPFVAVNCKAFADGVVESELFGHEKGSFTGAIAARAGCFERASGGTLFLDEIAEAGPDFQAKLLRVLEDGEVLRVGASKTRKVDVRIVAATNRMLRKEVNEGRFRADLYFRLNVIPVRIAPLRERPQDILPLANHFLGLYSAEAGRPITLSPEAERALVGYSFPGNIRELENIIERAVVMSGAELLTPDAFALEAFPSEPGFEASPTQPEVSTSQPAESSMSGASESLQECLDRAARDKINEALVAAKGNRALAATTLGVDRTTLYRLMKRLGLSER